MTSSAEPTLDELIDRLFTDKTWHSLRIFNGNYDGKGGPFLACVARDHSSSMVDQLTGEASPSAKLRNVLMQALKLKPPHANPPPLIKPVDDFDDILG